jgi:transposase InsO family protein
VATLFVTAEASLGLSAPQAASKIIIGAIISATRIFYSPFFSTVCMPVMNYDQKSLLDRIPWSQSPRTKGVYVSTLLDDFSRYVIAWKLCTNVRATDVKDTLSLAPHASGCEADAQTQTIGWRAAVKLEKYPTLSIAESDTLSGCAKIFLGQDLKAQH